MREETTYRIYDHDMEEVVLGAILLENQILEIIGPELHQEVFHKDAHRKIAFAIASLYKQNKPVDMLTVTARVREQGNLESINGAYAVASLTNRVANTDSTEYHFRLLQELMLRRLMNRFALELMNQSTNGDLDVFNVLSEGIASLEAMTTGFSSGTIKHVSKILKNNLDRILKLLDRKEPLGVPICHSMIMRAMGGWAPGDLTVLAARPAMGKSALLNKWIITPAMDYNIPTALFSLEMSETPIACRLQSIVTGVPADDLHKGRVSAHQVKQVEEICTRLSESPIYIDDNPMLTIYQLRQKVRKLVREKGVKLVGIDYLQLMTAEKGKQNREQEIAYLTRNLKILAKELQIHIIVLSQLSRECEKRGNKRPMLSDLRESGAIEQDADTVIFLFRASYYEETEINVDGRSIPAEGKAEIIIAKNRNGSLCHAIVDFIAQNTDFRDEDRNKPAPMQLQPNNNFF